MEKPTKPRSRQLTALPSRIGHRALLHACGLSRDDLEKPFIAVVNSWNEIVPGCIHLRSLAEQVKQGVWSAGGVPFEFNTIAVCDGLAQGHAGMKYSLPSREVIAASVEIMLQAHQFDAAVFISSCDKVAPGMLLAAARVDLPAIFVPAGHMEAGNVDGIKYTLSSLRELGAKSRRREFTDAYLKEIEQAALPGPGTCAMLGTANSMACIVEAMGLTLPDSATTPAMSSRKLREARRAGIRIVEMVKEGSRVSNLMTQASIENGLRAMMALGASTNAVLHILALASQIGLPIDLHSIDEISRSTPLLVQMAPSGPHTMQDLYDSGGIPALLAVLGPLIKMDAPTVSNRPLRESIMCPRNCDDSIIHSLADPVATDGGVAVLFGSLAPQGALVKKSAVTPAMWKHVGPAAVFASSDDALVALEQDSILPESVIVIPNQGPVGGPGMPEMHMVASTLAGMDRLADAAIVTDGRFSGATRGPCIGYVSPEAALGGPIGLVCDGDRVAYDFVKGRLDLLISNGEIDRRRKLWSPPAPPTSAVLRLTAREASSAATGAVWGRT